MNKKIIAIVAVLAAIGLVIYFLVVNSNPSPEPTPPTTDNSNVTTTSTPVVTPQIPEGSKGPEVTSATVDIKNFLFNPATLNIKTGTVVTWTNSDNVSHTVTSDSGTLLNSKTLAPGQSFSFTFTNAGTVKYHCAIHPAMKGTVVVTK